MRPESAIRRHWSSVSQLEFEDCAICSARITIGGSCRTDVRSLPVCQVGTRYQQLDVIEMTLLALASSGQCCEDFNRELFLALYVLFAELPALRDLHEEMSSMR